MPRRPEAEMRRLRRRVIQLANDGQSFRLIADQIGVHPATVSRIVNGVDGHAREAEQDRKEANAFPDPKPFSELPDDIKWCLELTPAGFKRFYERYSPWGSLPDHALTFVTELWDCEFGILKVPRSHIKSEVFSVWVPIHAVAAERALLLDGEIERTSRFMLVSATEHLAQKWTTTIARLLGAREDVGREANEKIARELGRFRPESPPTNTWMISKGTLLVEQSGLERDVNFLARSAGQQVQGTRYDRLVGDDLADREINQATPEQRAKLRRWFLNDLLPCGDPGAKSWLIGTPQHEEDLYAVLEESNEPEGDDPTDEDMAWKVVRFPALRDQRTGEPSLAPDALPLWPHTSPKPHVEGRCKHCRDRTFLNKRRKAMGNAGFLMTYQQMAVPLGEGLVKPEWVYGTGGHKGCIDRSRRLGETSMEEPFNRVVSIDPAPGPGFAALMALDLPIPPTDKKYIPFTPVITDIARTNMGMAGMMVILRQMCLQAEAFKHPVDYVIMEVTGVFTTWDRDPALLALRDEFGFKIVRQGTYTNKNKDAFGIDSLKGDFEEGNIRLPYGDPDAAAASKLLIDEAIAYPLGRTYDCVMALWFAKFQLPWLQKERRRIEFAQTVSGWESPLAGVSGSW